MANSKTIESADILTYSGNITSENQKDEYIYTVPYDGRTRVEIRELKNGTCVALYVYNALGECVSSDSSCYNGEGVTLKDLRAGETYKIQVRQNFGYPTYRLTIGQPKPEVDISDFTLVKDSIQYTDQRNVYSFTVPRDGRYRFELSGMKNGTCVELYVFDYLGNTVASDLSCYNNDGKTLKDLKAGEVYEVQVRQHIGFSGYTLKIGKQKKTISVSSNVVLSDSIEYVDQRNVYSFVADKSGTHTFTISGMQSGCSVELCAFNELGETIASDLGCYNGESITIKNLKPGDSYEIQVRYNIGFTNYKLTIE